MAFDFADGAFSESLFLFKVICRHNWNKIHFLYSRFSEDLASFVRVRSLSFGYFQFLGMVDSI